ncbi:MAG: hypothetical protein LBM74_01645 [Oscillospiraceae bacterium]|jgi:hypothetical protein|nr:hypothetical protein [Oscillospiraceae bacterium]
MQDTKITRARISNHFAYGWWKYLMLAIVAVLGWSLIYTSTAYRAPREKRLDVYFVTQAVDETATQWFKEQAFALLPELEDANCLSITFTEEDNYYGSIQLSTYMGAGEGDIYIVSRERFDVLKGQGTFLPLDEYIADGTLDLRGIDATNAFTTDEWGVSGTMGVPAGSLYGFLRDDLMIDNRDLVICVASYTANPPAAIAYVNWLIGEMQAEKPEWLIEYEQNLVTAPAESGVSEIPSY